MAHSTPGDTADAAAADPADDHDELKRTPDGWKISARKAEFLWSETRSQDEEFIGMLGGRGPEVWPRPS